MAKYKGAWPPPVYVATFANGETARASFMSPYGKPLDFAAGRRMVCHFARNWVDTATRAHWDSAHPYYSTPPRADLISGYVEFDGQEFADPMTSGKVPAAKLAPVDKLLSAIGKLSASERARLLAELAALPLAA